MSGISASRHHADWLSLVEVSGPFVSLPVLLKTFPQGLEPRDPAQAKALRAAYDEWQDNPAAPGRQRAWLLHVLTALLAYPAQQMMEGQALPAGLEANMAEMGETLRPDFALVGPAGTETAGQVHLLIASYVAEQVLDRPVIGRHWKANPATRMMELLHASGVPLGLVTNGEHWMLVFAPRGETTGYASWYGALWLDESITLRAFHSLLGVRRFFGVAADSTLLGLLKESAQDQQEVTDQLGYQVREAVEVLIQAFDTLDQDSSRNLLRGISETALYEAALTVMMRLVFLFSAEERGLLHLGKPLYDDNYAVSTLMEELQETADLYGPQVLERRFDAWARLLATFRAVHTGVHHQDLLMPAYGGSLFDPDRYPFLEGRDMGTNWASTKAEPLAVNNRVALHLLTSLQKLRIKVPGGGPSEARRISFRALGVEQIGHVYEGLLDHTAVRATGPVVGLKGTRDKQPEIALITLETTRSQGQDKLIDFLKEITGRSASAIKRAMDEDSPCDEHRLLIACSHDTGLLRSIRPFASLIREDSFERPVIVLPGSIYVTASTTRRSTGTHYTPPSLTKPIVQHTLEPLVYQGPAEGWQRERWQLKSPKGILDLKVCDMAMGSGAFLVQACRYLAERLVEAWENEEKKHPDEVLATPEGGFSQGAPSERLVPQDSAERLAIARRIVADRCLYGVDINPMAVEMAKLSLWLVTIDAKRPFTFLDHAFKCGDSLLGLSTFKQLENFSLRPEGGKQIAFSTTNLWRHIEEAKKKREALEAMPSDTPEQIAAKGVLYAEAEETVTKLKAAADLLVAVELRSLKGRKYEEAREVTADHMMAYWAQGPEELRRYASEQLNGRKTFHWALAFPEIMQRGGFDGILGNPPFLGGKRLTTVLGEEYAFGLKVIISSQKGAADLCAYFFLRAESLLSRSGTCGLLATNSISEGDTREIGLAAMLSRGCSLYRVIRNAPWPGIAGVNVSHLHFAKSPWLGPRLLDDKVCDSISSYLEQGEGEQAPFQLVQNSGLASIGTYVNGTGFILSPDEYTEMLKSDPKNAEVIQPFLTSDDINQSPDGQPTRYIINFANMSAEEASQFKAPFERVTLLVKPVRDKLTRQVHEKCYWKHWDRREAFYDRLSKLNRAIVMGRVSKQHAFTFKQSDWLAFDGVVIFLWDDFAHFALLQSSIHEVWVKRYMTTLQDRPRYSVSDCFLTFPLPPILDDPSLATKGAAYHEERLSIQHHRNEGLTDIYNRFHNSQEISADIAELRRLHADMDQSVAEAYTWSDLPLGHGFHETKQGLRYTVSEIARREILDRLLALNLQHDAEEEAAATTLPAQLESTAKRKGNAKADEVQPVSDLFDSRRERA